MPMYDPSKIRASAQDYVNRASKKLREEEIDRWRRAFPTRPEYWPTEADFGAADARQEAYDKQFALRWKDARPCTVCGELTSDDSDTHWLCRTETKNQEWELTYEI